MAHPFARGVEDNQKWQVYRSVEVHRCDRIIPILHLNFSNGEVRALPHLEAQMAIHLTTRHAPAGPEINDGGLPTHAQRAQLNQRFLRWDKGEVRIFGDIRKGFKA